LLARGPGQADRALEDNVKFKAIATVVAATALMVTMADSALASPLSHTSKPAPQVTGVRLQSALLPASAFGDGFTVVQRLNTGKKLWSTRAVIKPSKLSCVKFETYIYVGGYGNTAGATVGLDNPDPSFLDYPFVAVAGDQAVLQFKTTRAAASFYSQAYARYKQCQFFTEPGPAGSGAQWEYSNQSLFTTTIDKNKAFQLVQAVDLSSMAGLTFYENTAVVLAGTNVYTIDDLEGANDPISASLLGNLISHVQALYKHR
jgi:hypothetical protein